MLDRWFADKLSRAGRIAYVVGQLLFLGATIGVMLGGLGMSWRDARWPFIGIAIVFVLVWGFACTLLWPKERG